MKTFRKNMTVAAIAAALLTGTTAPASAGPQTTMVEQAGESVVGMAVGCGASAALATLITIFTGGVGAVTWAGVGTACATGLTIGGAGVVAESIEDGRTYR